VLGYSAIVTGAGFAAFALSVAVSSNVAQLLVTRLGVRPVLTGGLLLAAVSLALLTQLPADGSYVANLLPAYLLGGLGMGLTFVPMTIAGLSGVAGADAGVASGLINTSRQIGGSVGIAAMSTIVATYANVSAATTPTPAALTHGFDVAFDVLTALALVAAVLAARFITRAPRAVEAGTLATETIESLEEAA
jgi:MFS family permease